MKLPLDKLVHAIVGGTIFVLSYFMFKYYSIEYYKEYALAISFIAGVAKEGYDYLANAKALKSGQKPKHTVDPLDLVATTLGGLIFFIILG